MTRDTPRQLRRFAPDALSRPPRWLAAALIAALAAGCSTVDKTPERPAPPAPARDLMSIPDAVPRVEPMSRYGNPESYEVFGRRYHTLRSSRDYRARGVASWYGPDFHGKRTSSGEPYDMYAMTAAHKELPLPTYARVTNLRNGRSIVVRINDRGPFHDNRIIDLSLTAATKLDVVRDGTGLVEVVAIDPTAPEPGPTQVATAPPRQAAQPGPVRVAMAPPPRAENPAPMVEPRLFLQVGAFGSRSNAERLKERLTPEVDSQVRIQTLGQDTQPLYRVQLGPLASVELADAMTETLQSRGFRDTHVVVE